MADFEIKANQLMNVSSQFSNIQKSIKNISSEANRVLRQTRGSITAKIGAALQRTVVCANINNCANDMGNLSKGLSEAVQYYLAYEKNVLNKTFGKAVKIKKSSSVKSKWEQFKEDFGKKVKGVSKAVQKKVNDIKSTVKNTAQKLWNGLKSGATKAWDFMKDTAGNIKDSFVSAYNYLKDSYNDHGWVYKAVQYGKAAISIVGSTAAIVGAVASMLGSGGLSTPAAIATIIYSANSIANSVTDISNVANENYDEVGKVNWLKTGLADAGGWVGKQLGNEDLGEAIGTGVYYAGSLYTMVSNLSNAVDRTKQVDSVKFSDAWNSAKKLGGEQINVGKLMTTDVNQLRLQYTLLKKSQDYKALFDYAGNVKTYYTAFKASVDFGFDAGEGIHDVINVATGQDNSNAVVDWYRGATKSNPAVDTYKDVKGAYDDSKDIWDTVSNLYKAQRLTSTRSLKAR